MKVDYFKTEFGACAILLGRVLFPQKPGHMKSVLMLLCNLLHQLLVPFLVLQLLQLFVLWQILTCGNYFKNILLLVYVTLKADLKLICFQKIQKL